MLTCHVKTVPSGSKPRFILASLPLNSWFPPGWTLLAEAASEGSPGMVTIFYSWALFPEPLGSACEEERDRGVEIMDCHSHQASPAFFFGLHTVRAWGTLNSCLWGRVSA